MPFGRESLRLICYSEFSSKSLEGNGEIGMGVFMCSTLGTPTEDVWPNVTKLPYYNKEFPKWPIRSIKKTIECLDPLAEDLLNVGIGWMVDHV